MKDRLTELAECPRCGYERRINQSRDNTLCRDCRDVTIDLDELDRWVA